jgi:hypothetical protein
MSRGGKTPVMSDEVVSTTTLVTIYALTDPVDGRIDDVSAPFRVADVT